ncbi:MAG: tetratricopeptide repeat protein [Candidatus Riflebacteria bacterium]|nr:tetratricopeptide repeat protein [Candidatus Riflebacteria bacterium]
MADPRKNPLDRVCIEPSQKRSDEIRSLLRGQTRPSSSPPVGVRHELDARLTRYDDSSQKTIEEIQRHLEIDPKNASLLDWLAFMLYTNERFSEAIALYQRLLELNPDNPTAHYYTANCFYRMGDVERAVQSWRRTMILCPTGKMGRKASARIDMARGRHTASR